MKCKCQDSSGKVCGKEMTEEEYDQDGMCQNCGDELYTELTTKEYVWSRPTKGEDDDRND